MTGQSPVSLSSKMSVTVFSQQDVCHADFFIGLTVLVDYQRNELSRLHRGVYEAAHTVYTLLRKWKGRNLNINLLIMCNTGSNSLYAVAVDS